jgi:aminopeptidase-like protein
MHEIMKKEIHASFAVEPQSAEIMAMVYGKCLVKMGKALSYRVQYIPEGFGILCR